MEEVQEDKQVGTPPILSRELNGTIDFTFFSNLQGYTGLCTCFCFDAHSFMGAVASCISACLNGKTKPTLDLRFVQHAAQRTTCSIGALDGFCCYKMHPLACVFKWACCCGLYSVGYFCTFNPYACFLTWFCRKLRKILRRKGQMMTKA